MKILVFGRSFNRDFSKHILDLFQWLCDMQVELWAYEPFLDFLFQEIGCQPCVYGVFRQISDVGSADYALSIGGDGTFLETAQVIKDSNIPIIGINTGRLGFMADISPETMRESLEEIFKGHQVLEKRSVLQLETECGLFGNYNFALNEVAVMKRDTSSLITIHTYLDGEYLNSFWSDGLLVSTATGSTAYSLSLGGPIILPKLNCFIINPIAPHNLTVRPMVIPDYMEIRLRVEGRSDNFLVSLDSRSEVIDSSVELVVRKAPFSVNVVQRPGHNYYETIRNKLMWGADKRNY